MTIIGYYPEQLLFMFILFCNIGWVQESVIESLYHRRPVNRGFLKGPYIPIYGFGGMFLLICCVPFKDNGFLVYFVGMLGCTVLEYFVGWLLESIFHKQFWDYSMLKFTYKNRISLISSLFWGLLALFMVYILHGIVDWVLGVVPNIVMMIYTMVMSLAMLVDFIVTVVYQSVMIKKLKTLPYDKVKKIVTEKFIELGGAVIKRREMLKEFRIKLRNSKELEIMPEQSPVSETDTEEKAEI